MSILDNVGAEATPDENAEYLVEDEQFSTEFPGLFEFLARVKIGGVERKPGRLIMYYEPGKAHLCLSDQHTGSVAWHASETHAEALVGAERRLQDGKLDWRKDKRRRY
jgi:hypothetical protein